MYEIRSVPIGLIDANPYRDLGTYPWIERKVEQLQRSIADVGFWAGVIGRPKGKRYQLAFGHHRLEAVRRNKKLKEVPLIVDALTNEQMLQFMGRENGEDYNADFLVMLNTWEAALTFFSADQPKIPQAIDIARLLGWTAVTITGGKQDQMNHTARACHAAHALINGGHIARSEFEGKTVYQVESIAGAAFNRMQQAEELGRRNKATPRQIEEAKKTIGKAASFTARRTNEIAQRDLRSSVDIQAYRFARESQRSSPLFAHFGKTVIEQIERMANTDTVAEKLAEIAKAIPSISGNEDKQVVQRIDLALEQLGDRAEDWRKKLRPGKNVVPLSAVPGKGA